MLVLQFPGVGTYGFDGCSWVFLTFDVSLNGARPVACFILTAAVMSPGTVLPRLVLSLVSFALLTVAFGCYHMSSGISLDDW